MKRVFFAGAVAAVAFYIFNGALALLNQPSDLSVTAGYFVLLALVSAATGAVLWITRRRL